MLRCTRRALIFAALSAVLPAAADGPAKPSLLVLAAASMTDALQDLGVAYTQATGIDVRFSFAASSALARQIESGAPADLYLSADQDWMDYLQGRGLIESASRRNIAGNRLVLVAAAGSSLQLAIAPGFKLAEALGGQRLAIADPSAVPAGKYAQASLTSLGVWSTVEGHLVRAENVRAALAFVARGEVSLGIVYATDARVDPKVRIVDYFPDASHPPIRYPLALTTTARPEATGFLQYVAGAPGQAVFRKYGFTPVP